MSFFPVVEVALACTAVALFVTLMAPRADAARRPRMLDPWTGPHGGAPDWSVARVDEFVPAFRIAMDEQRAELRAIVDDPAPPTFDNTILALERSGATRRRVGAFYEVYTSTLNLDAMQKVQESLSPVLAAFDDEITQNTGLFARIAAVYAARESSGLTPEQQRLAWVYYRRFVRAGAALDAAKKERLSAINQRLASCFTEFSQHLLDDEEKRFTVFDDAQQVDGLPADLREAAAQAATERGLAGKWVIANTRSSVEPFLTFVHDRAARQAVWTVFVNRGDNRDSTDNNALVTEILQLRYERAQLLCYATHAHWRLEPQMAATPDNAMRLMESVWTPAVAQVRDDVAAMQAIADGEGAGVRIAPWDYRYYAEKLRKAQYDLDFEQVKPYLQLDKLRDGMFWAAETLYGMHFVALPEQSVQHPDVRVWEVTDAQGAHLGLWYLDPYARAGKGSGAWMVEWRLQSMMDGGQRPIVSNNSNFVKGQPGEPVLIGWNDAVTMFHEFGHALHGLLSNVDYPTLSCTNVAQDFAEFPSQINEQWFPTHEILSRFATHYRTGEPMPESLLAKIEKAKRFNIGFDTVEYLASALIDMKLHLAGAGPIDARAFERDELAKLGMPAEIVMRHRIPQFAHVFATDDYSAGYYSYLWSDALTADAWEAFLEAGGPWDAATAARFKSTVLAAGNTQDQAAEFRAFRGRDVSTDALMRKRGFPVPAPVK